jgi:ornithine cyclodeaminase
MRIEAIMRTIGLLEMKRVLPAIDLVGALESGFVAYSQGKAVVPPVGELLFQDPPGDVHIKYGYLPGEDYYVIKIASGFYKNPEVNLPSGNGLMLLFSQKTGELKCILLDEGYLTDVRTAVAGAIAAKHLAPGRVNRIGILGTGVQARMQLQYLALATDCKNVLAWGRRSQGLDQYRKDMEEAGFDVAAARHAGEIAADCNLIVTATVSTSPLLHGAEIRPGTHITAVGADASYKQELDPAILKRADLVVADSISQCCERGEIAHALRAGLLQKERLLELGNVIAGTAPRRTSDSQITVADLTGVAVQDIQIAKAVFEAVKSGDADRFLMSLPQ